MVAVCYFIAFALLLYRILKKETIIDVVLLSGLLLPDIYGVEASNILLIILFMLIILTKMTKRIVIQNSVIKYVITCFVIMMIGIISWAYYCGHDVSFLLRTSLSIIRYPLIVMCLDIYENRIFVDVKTYINKLYYTISILVSVNFACCMFQKLNKGMALQIFSKLYSYSDFHFNELMSQSKFYRAYGTWESPMSLGIMSLLCLCLLIFVHEFQNKRLCRLEIILCMLIGVMSLTKTFFIGVVILMVCVYSIKLGESIKKNKYSGKDFFRMILGLVFVMLCIMAYFQIYDWSAYTWPHLHYYMGFIMKPFEAFETRMSSGGSLSNTIEVVKDYFLIGVGPVPIRGELLGDNSYIVLLHNGGIVAMVIAIFHFGTWYVKCFRYRDYRTITILALWMICGMSIPILLNMKICMLPATYFLIIVPYFWQQRGDLA